MLSPTHFLYFEISDVSNKQQKIKHKQTKSKKPVLKKQKKQERAGMSHSII